MNKFNQLKRAYTDKYMKNGIMFLLFIISAIACIYKDNGMTGIIIGSIGLLFLLRIGWFILVSKTTEYEITSNYIKTSYGVLSKNMDTMDMTNVKDVAIRRTILDRLLGISKVFIISKDKTNPVSAVFGLMKEDCQHIFDFINENAIDTYVEVRGRKRKAIIPH
jgi:hypothetical protein